MVSLLELSRNKELIGRDLLRRIGYTNGLHDIWRFARVVEYLHPLIPTSSIVLRSIIIDSEDSVSGTKYAQGVIDVTGALGLLAKVGQTLSLSDQGYALHAVLQMEDSEQYRRAFMLEAVLQADGEATLNLLDIITNESNRDKDTGNLLMDRLLRVMDVKEHLAESEIRSRFAKDIVINEISEARKRLQSALDVEKKNVYSVRTPIEERQLNPEERVKRFIDHTVVPRRKWLLDLECMSESKEAGFELTQTGQRLLAMVKSYNYREAETITLPFSPNLSQILGLEESEDDKDFFWRSIAGAFNNSVAFTDIKDSELLDLIKELYPHVKLHAFNEAEVSAIYHSIACMEASEGRLYTSASFEKQLETLFRSHGDQVFHLRGRQDPGGYIAIRGFN